MQKCLHRDCGKFYHRECVATHPLAFLEDNKIECPLHFCASCARGDKNNAKARVGKFVVSRTGFPSYNNVATLAW